MDGAEIVGRLGGPFGVVGLLGVEVVMTDGFWSSLHLDVLWPILIPQIVILLKQWWDGRRAKEAQAVTTEAQTHLAAKIDENTLVTVSVKDAAERSKSEVSQAFMAGERSGYKQGIPEGRRQATGPAPLGDR